VSKILGGLFLVAVGLVAGLIVQTTRLTPRLRALLAENKALAAQAATVDSVYVRDTLTLTRTRTRTDSILSVDTLLRVDTVRAIVADERAACSAVIRTCEERVAVRDSRIATLEEAVRVASRRPRLSWNAYGATDLKGGLYAGAEARVRLLGLEAFGRLEQRIDSTGQSVRVGAVIPF
jgi:hypothetical protein